MMTVLVNGFIRMKTIYMSKVEIRGFNKIDRCVLAKWSRKINCILKYIRTEYITDTNILIKALIVYQDLIQAKMTAVTAFGCENRCTQIRFF